MIAGNRIRKSGFAVGLKKRKKGKILKVKIGYNPNSSSIGTLLKAFPCALFGSAVLFNIAAGIIFSRKLKGKEKNKASKK